MKLLNILAEEVSEFDQPVQNEFDKAQGMIKKAMSLGHHKVIFSKILDDLDQLNKQGKLTPILRQKFKNAIAKLNMIDDQLESMKLRIGSSKIGHPFGTCELALYAGPPEQYPDLTTSQVKLLQVIQQILVNAGFPPLSLLYGGRRSQAYGGINFVAVNADLSFAWRKYDPSPGAGQNWVYFSGCGSNYKTSDFVSKPTKAVQILKDSKAGKVIKRKK